MIELIPNEWRYRDAETKQICPWYTKPVVEMLYGMDLTFKSVFEYGVGDSTKWFYDKGCTLCGVDNNYEWVVKIADISNVQHLDQEINYIQSIDNHQSLFDIIVIDGIHRDLCLKFALNYLATDGFIIVDNFEQPSVEAHWAETRRVIQENNLKLEIYKEEGHQDWQTAIVRL